MVHSNELQKLCSSILVPLCSNVILPHRRARHLYRRNGSLFTAASLISTIYTQGIRVGWTFNSFGRSQSAIRLPSSKLWASVTLYLPVLRSAPLFSLFFFTPVFSTARFSYAEDDIEALALLPLTTFRSAASPAASLADRVFTIGTQCAFIHVFVAIFLPFSF